MLRRSLLQHAYLCIVFSLIGLISVSSLLDLGTKAISGSILADVQDELEFESKDLEAADDCIGDAHCAEETNLAESQKRSRCFVETFVATESEWFSGNLQRGPPLLTL